MNLNKQMREILENPIVSTKSIFHCYVDERKLTKLLQAFRDSVLSKKELANIVNKSRLNQLTDEGIGKAIHKSILANIYGRENEIKRRSNKI